MAEKILFFFFFWGKVGGGLYSLLRAYTPAWWCGLPSVLPYGGSGWRLLHWTLRSDGRISPLTCCNNLLNFFFISPVHLFYFSIAV